MSDVDYKNGSELVGDYTYRRVFYDERPMRLEADGVISTGSAAGERTWSVTGDNGNRSLAIQGEHGLLCRLRCEPDGVWRGRWEEFERMPIELIPADLLVPALVSVKPGPHFKAGAFHFISYAQLLADTAAFTLRLPPLRAVVGNPRSGLLPATIIALARNVPLLPLDELLLGYEPHLPALRRRSSESLPRDGVVLVVDDTAASGRQLAYLRSRIKADVKYAAIYADEQALPLVDYHYAPHCRLFQSYEWTLLHDEHARHTLCDLDGVICQDWAGDEDADPDAYRSFLESSSPLRLPTVPLMAIVTGRLEVHRAATERWLAKHKVQYGRLHMMPAKTTAERSRVGTAEFKSRIYGEHPQARVFVESCAVQARRIHELTGRPVIDFGQMKVCQAPQS